ncbi:hypothetical protein DYB37_013294 [Aphanomyces astaci]|uniref:Uncharacterized protein n=2 Tax=Aphanomyces astaci TaxID=112090 RepID=A0A3R7BDY0_APHAT|nr:hypothetical protein DYB35_013234 [Aphanomyces astaci]RHZ30274.1 hypothetical protein DYB37_013294 [Aphanomyces astaci]
MGLSTTTVLRACSIVALALFLWRSAVHSIEGDIRDASRRTPNLLTPMDASFSIWGVIYAWLIVFVLREWFVPSAALESSIYALHLLFIASSVCSTLWMELFVTGYTRLSFAPIFGSWLILFAAYLYVESHIEPIVVTSILASRNADYVFDSTSRADFWCIRVPFTIYWAWTCAATTISLNILVEECGVHAMGFYVFWCGLWVLANVLILIGVGDVPFAAVALWTLVGIAVRNSREKHVHAADVQWVTEHYALEVMATVGAFVFGSLFLFLVLHKWWRGPKRPVNGILNTIPSTATTYGTAV